MRVNKIEVLDLELFFGLEYHMPVRAIINIVPDEIRVQRIRNANIKSRKGKASKEYSLWAGINVYLTNTIKNQLTPGQIIKVYRSRWQVEVVFKTWKSYYNLNMYKSVKRERVLCYLYASLIQIMLHWQLFNFLQQKIWERNKKLISLIKFSKIMHHYKEQFLNVLHRKKDALINLIKTLLFYSRQFLYREKKKGKLGFEDQIIMRNNIFVSKTRKSDSLHIKQNRTLKKYETHPYDG
jgi:hypothetical protein